MSTDAHGHGILPPEFYARDTITVARELLGAVLVSRAGGETASGRIVETEAYLGAHDAGSHAATKGITKRNAVMYGPPGRAYVYFTYGNHNMLNFVTEPEGIAGAVLVRALEPIEGIEFMSERRGTSTSGRPIPTHALADGPGKLARALGVTLADNGTPLDGTATLCVLGATGTAPAVGMSGRIGLSDGHDALLRFFIEGDPHVSKARPGPRPGRGTRREGR